jgi:hypothetical protein
MFLRFTTTRIDEDSHKPEGVFQAGLSLLDSGDLDRTEWTRLREILIWFNKNLPSPESFSADRAIFWFKSAADESIKRVWDLVHILRAHECHVVVHKCRRLGNICYEDKFQVAAYPSKLDGRVNVQ